MKTKTTFGALLIASSIAFSLSACELPEDGATAADQADVNQADSKAGKNGKGGKNGKAQKAGAVQESVSQANARESAETYLDTAPFSREGLIKQLKFEGYSKADAVYGVDAQDANWKKQAAAAGENYLDMSSFSREGLIQQLEFEGYTAQQAAYAATQNGL